MKALRRQKWWLGISLLLLLALSACSGQRMAASGWPGLTVEADTVYLANNSFVLAVESEQGQVRWRYPKEAERGKSFYAPPILAGDQLLIGGYDHVLYSLDPATGAERWTFEQARAPYVGAPLVTEMGIFAPNADGTLYALDLQGNVRWTFSTDQALWAMPVTDGERLFVPSMDHTLYALDPQNGAVLWKTALGGALVSAPQLVDGVLYQGMLDDQLAALDAATGEVLWEAALQGWVWSTPGVAGERMFVGDVSGNFYALDRQTGEVLWQIRPDGPIVGTPVAQEDVVYFTTEVGTVLAVDAATGTTRWTYTVNAPLHAGPVLTPTGLLVVAPTSGDQALIALDTNGQVKWTVTTPR